MKLSYRCTCEREFKRDKYSGLSNLDGRSKGAKNIKKNHCIICFVRSLEWRFLKMPGVKCRMLLENFALII